MNPGIYLAHKSAGTTSFSLVQELMERVRLAGIRRDKLPVCHGGALDPFAEGLLLLLAGQATKLMEFLHPIPKAYLAEIAWGVETDNGDLLGRAVGQGDAARLTPALLDAALARFIGFQDQVPPNTSNKRIDGERAYRKAHRGEEFVLPPSLVYLHEARFVAHDLPRTSTLSLVCRGGYYVRSLARDLGRATGALGHLTKLRRTAIGPWLDPAALVPPGEPSAIGLAIEAPAVELDTPADTSFDAPGIDPLSRGALAIDARTIPAPSGEARPMDGSSTTAFSSGASTSGAGLAASTRANVEERGAGSERRSRIEEGGASSERRSWIEERGAGGERRSRIEERAIRGDALLPWMPSRLVTAREIEQLRSRKAIARQEVLAPSWPLPAGFPSPDLPVRALHDGKLVALLRERDGALSPDLFLHPPL